MDRAYVDIDIAELPDADKKYGSGAMQDAHGFRVQGLGYLHWHPKNAEALCLSSICVAYFGGLTMQGPILLFKAIPRSSLPSSKPLTLNGLLNGTLKSPCNML